MNAKRLLASAGSIVALVCCLAPAQAIATEFSAAGYPASVKGEGEGTQSISFDEGKATLSCSGIGYSGELSKASQELSLAPTYTGCTLGGLSATVSANGCTYKLHSGEELSEEKLSGPADLVCPAEKSIVVKATSTECEVQLAAQTSLSVVEYLRQFEPEPPKVTMTLSLSGIKYTKSKDGFLCPLNGTGTKTDGKASGKALLQASAGGETIAFQDGTVSILVPKEVSFKGVNDAQKFFISNSGSSPWKILLLNIAGGGTGTFKAEEKCFDKLLEGGKSCEEEVVCKAPGNGDLRVSFTYGIVFVALKC